MPAGAEASVWQTNLWPGGVVPYAIDPGVSQLNRNRLRIAMDEISTIANITFVPRTSQSNYLYVQNGGGNSSFVGQIGGSQPVNLVSWNERYVIIHELYHALGQWHEQQRPDRDTYVIINQANVNPGNFPQNFNIPGGVSAQGPYNFESLMHYGRCDFSICGCPPCTVIDPRPGFEAFAGLMGNRTYMSQGDRDSIISRYGPATDDSFEDNDNLAAAYPLAPGSYGLRLTDTDDYFSVDMPGGGPVGVGFSAALWSGSNAAISILTPGGVVLASATPTDPDSDGTYEGFVTAQVNPGTAIIRVSRSQPWGGSYQVNVAASCVAEPWKQVVAAAGPSARIEAAAAFDPVRGRTVVFGGQLASGQSIGDTWEWDGSRWFSLQPASSPSPRYGARMVFDSARGVCVMFGGATTSTNNETWEWNGTNWTQRSPAVSPSPRGGVALSFDSSRARTVLFGGFGIPNATFSDTWEFDGTNWTQRFVPGPSSRGNSNMVYDQVRARSVLFGGFTAGQSVRLSDTWEWDGTAWVQSPATGPTGVEYVGLAYDSVRQRVVHYGGWTGTSAVSTTWEYNGSSWTQASTVSPRAKAGNTLVFDSIRQRILSFGGDLSPGMLGAELWSFNGSTWLPVAGPQQPSARGRCELIADTNSQRVLLFGGGIATDNAAIRDFWVHKNGVWGQYSLPTEGAAIVGIHSYCSAFDSGRNRAVLFGGVNQFTGALSSNTWELEPSGWNQSAPATVPAARDRAAMVYDVARSQCVMFGGSTGAAFPPETWTYNGVNWSVATSSGPGTRYHHAMAYDPVRQRTVCFGGILGPSQQLTNDLWEWNGTSWSQIIPPSSPGSPSPRYGHRLAYDAERGAIVLFGGNNLANEFAADTWAWNGAAWARLTDNLPEGRNMFGFAPEPSSGRLVMFGGIRVAQTNSDTWRFDSISDPPVFTSQPQSATVEQGTQAQFNAPATDAGPFTYRWFATTNNAGVQGSVALNDLDRGGRVIGVFTPLLRINSAQASDATTQPAPGVFVNRYFCVVSNVCQSSTSDHSSLTVNIPPPPCIGDVNNDQRVDTVDLVVMLGIFGTAVSPGNPADIDGSGFVNTVDLTLLLGRFGTVCQ